MDFFSHQDRARRRTAWLVVLFVLAVVLIVIAVNAIIGFALAVAGITTAAADTPPSLPLHGGITAGTLGVIGAGTLYRVAMLRGGGAAVATMVGAHPVLPDSSDALERRLLNVVEEMALASGMPVPDVFVMPAESGINAFAAGYRSDNAVIAVTRGALEQLDRDELQGVIAHEFSHIFNGDMRLNVRLLGFLNGILVIGLIGMHLLRGTGRASSGRDSRGAWLAVLVGGGLAVVGYVGVLFARIIKAAVSRQREFLADASAVQYTRNPAGLAGALDRIGQAAAGAHVDHAQAEQLSHMFFSDALNVHFLSGLFATHPPLLERIERIHPGFERARREAPPGAPAATAPAPAGTAGLAAGATTLVDSIGQPTAAHVGYAAALLSALPAELRAATTSPEGARAVVYALLMAVPGAPIARQRELLAQFEFVEVAGMAARLQAQLSRGDVAWRLPAFDLAAPALRALGVEQQDRLRRTMAALIRADQRVSLAEYVVDVLVQRLLAGPGRERIRYHDPETLRPDCAVLVALLAHAGSDDEAAAAAAFDSGMRVVGVSGAQMPARMLLSLSQLEGSLARLNAATYAVRRVAVRAAAATALADRKVRPGEIELLRALSAALDCPMPPIVAGAT